MIRHYGLLHQVRHQIDDAAFKALPHGGQHRLTHVKTRLHCTINLRLVGVPTQLPKPLALFWVKAVGRKGVVHQHIHTAQLRNNALHHVVYRCLGTHIGSQSPSIAARLATTGRHGLGLSVAAQVIHHHIRALSGKSARNGCANAPACTSDQHHLIFKLHAGLFSALQSSRKPICRPNLVKRSMS